MRRQPIGSNARSLAVSLQSGVEAFDQSFSVEGLGQETGRSRLHSLRARALDGEGRDENERHAVSLGQQVGLQLDPAHCRHLHICYHTRVSFRWGDRKNSSADSNVWTTYPSDLTRLWVAARTDPSSSMIEITGGLDNAVLPGGANRMPLAAQPPDGRVRRKTGPENHT
jgi:hypothetical protein